jgi:hypothetical protein
VRLIEYREVESRHVSGCQPLPHRVGSGGIDADNEEASARLGQRVAFGKIGATKDGEFQIEKMPEFPPPVPGEARRRADDRSPEPRG